MATPFEIKWAGLINRPNWSFSLFERAEFASVRVGRGSVSYFWGEWKPVDGFSLPPVECLIPVTSPKPIVELMLGFYDKVTFSWFQIGFRLVWPPDYLPIYQGLTLTGRKYSWDPSLEAIWIEFKRSSLNFDLPDPPSEKKGFSREKIWIVPLKPQIQNTTQLSGFVLEVARRFFVSERRRGRKYGSKLRMDVISPKTEFSMWPSESYDVNGVLVGQGSVLRERLFRSYTSVQTPGFHSIPKRKLPVNPYSLRLRLTENSLGYTSWKGLSTNAGQTFVSNSRDLIYVPTDAFPSHDVEAYNKAVSRLISAADRNLTLVTVDTTQFGKTVKLIGDSADRIARSFLQLKRGNISKGVEILFHGRPPRFKKGWEPSVSKSLADNVLAVQYGWKPLLQSIDGSIQALQKYIARTDNYRASSGSAKVESKTVTDLMYSTLVSEGVPSFSVGKIETLVRTRSRLGMNFKLNDHHKAFLGQTGFTSPVSLAWEIIPFSFIWDWFQPIGPFLDSFAAFDGFEFLDGFHTSVTTETVLAHSRYSGVKQGSTQLFRIEQSGDISRTKVVFDRVRLTAFPVHRFPTFKNPVSVVHAVNALALLRSIRG